MTGTGRRCVLPSHSYIPPSRWVGALALPLLFPFSAFANVAVFGWMAKSRALTLEPINNSSDAGYCAQRFIAIIHGAADHSARSTTEPNVNQTWWGFFLAIIKMDQAELKHGTLEFCMDFVLMWLPLPAGFSLILLSALLSDR